MRAGDRGRWAGPGRPVLGAPPPRPRPAPCRPAGVDSNSAGRGAPTGRVEEKGRPGGAPGTRGGSGSRGTWVRAFHSLDGVGVAGLDFVGSPCGADRMPSFVMEQKMSCCLLA